MSPIEANGSSVTVTASWYAFTTQIDAAGVTCMSRAIVGSAILAIEVTSTDMATAMATVSIARHRCGGGSPSVTSGSLTWIERIASSVCLTPCRFVNKLARSTATRKCNGFAANARASSCRNGSMPTAT